MDGSSLAIPSATPPGGLARDDALFRIVYYGEALRAMTEHVSDKLISGACGPMIDMLDDAFDRMSETRDSFGPEEFTLFVMSKMLGLCEDVDEARQFQIGAARYILKSSEALPDAYSSVVNDARQMINSTDAVAVTASVPAGLPTALTESNKATQTSAIASPDDPPEPEVAVSAPAAASAIHAQPATRAATMPAMRTRSAAVPEVSRGTPQAHSMIASRRLNLSQNHRARNGLEWVLAWGVVLAIVVIILMVGLGYIDLSEFGRLGGSADGITRP